MSPKTIRQLTRLVTQAGGTIEEDEGLSDCRLFQAVAPTGKVWAGSDLLCLLIYWPRGGNEWAVVGRKDTYLDLQERLSHGLRDMTAAELDEHATD